MMHAQIFLTASVASISPLAPAEDINGFCKHADEPGWIGIRLDDGKGSVVRNDKFTERVGREIVKDLEVDESKTNLWRGQVYAERLGDYGDAEISLPGTDRMRIKVKAGIISRSVEWVRVGNAPTEEGLQ